MSQRLIQHITHQLNQGKKLFSVYITAGFPEKSATLPILQALDAAGVDFVELGIPFSDPIADGPTIQAAANQAIENGVTLEWILETVQQFRQQSDMPIILMGYLNPVIQYGMERFSKACRQSGVDGVILPDFPWEEAQQFQPYFSQANLDNIYLIAPNTPSDRIQLLARATTAFLYCTAYTGTTGADHQLDDHSIRFFNHLKQTLSVPYIIGFGIKNARQVQYYQSLADGVVVGSAFIQAVSHTTRKDIPHVVTAFVNSLRPTR